MVMIREPECKITPDDLELIKRLCLSYKDIGRDLNVLATTANERVARLIVKFRVESRTAVVVKALKLGLVTMDELIYKDLVREFNGQ